MLANISLRCLRCIHLARPVISYGSRPTFEHKPYFVKNFLKQDVSFLVRDFSSKPLNLPPTVTYEEVVESLQNSTALVIDVRNAEELVNDGAIPGALHIPLSDLEVGDNSSTKSMLINRCYS